jgi:hypothetical protein
MLILVVAIALLLLLVVEAAEAVLGCRGATGGRAAEVA